jgi:hypothetical protein
MKEIELPSHVIGQSVGDAPVPSLKDAVAHATEARRNGNKVILAGLYIEREMELIIGFYLYPSPTVSEQQRFFADHILSSDALTFSHKRRLLLALVDAKRLMEGKARSALEARLRKAMSLRNAFAHGDVVERANGTFLIYFEGGRKEHELTDAYWDTVVDTIKSLEKQLGEIKEALGIPLRVPWGPAT